MNLQFEDEADGIHNEASAWEGYDEVSEFHSS
jgi:hypothetical protein